MADPLYRVTFDAAALLREHPPRFRHPHKAMLFELAYPGGIPSSGTVDVTRWAGHLPESAPLPATLAAEVRPNFYDYRPADDGMDWHVNFADPRVFGYYGSALFAQDEMQVAEHPALASVREALLAEQLAALTVDGSGATPILVRGVERRIAVATNADVAAGRPMGLYGNRFGAASADVVRRATRRIDPPTITNLIAIAAPSGGHGKYTAAEVRSIFANAHTAFAAAVHESAGQSTIVHTGFWGCGAFGGNRRLMIALQALATHSAGVARLVLHTGDEEGSVDARLGLETADDLAATCGSPCNLTDLVTRVEMLGFYWGVGDGN